MIVLSGRDDDGELVLPHVFDTVEQCRDWLWAQAQNVEVLLLFQVRSEGRYVGGQWMTRVVKSREALDRLFVYNSGEGMGAHHVPHVMVHDPNDMHFDTFSMFQVEPHRRTAP
jgi:hypothetical protein